KGINAKMRSNAKFAKRNSLERHSFAPFAPLRWSFELRPGCSAQSRLGDILKSTTSDCASRLLPSLWPACRSEDHMTNLYSNISGSPSRRYDSSVSLKP